MSERDNDWKRPLVKRVKPPAPSAAPEPAQAAPAVARDMSDDDMDAIQGAINRLGAGDIGYHAFCDEIIAIAAPAPVADHIVEANKMAPVAQPDAFNRRLRAQLEQEWCDLQSLKADYAAAPPAKGAPAQPALARFKELDADKSSELATETPLERLRYFLSLCLIGQDWLDVEQFLDALAHPPHGEVEGEPTNEALEAAMKHPGVAEYTEMNRLAAELSAAPRAPGAEPPADYDENAPLHERLRSHVPKSARYGSTFLEDDLLEAAAALTPKAPAEPAGAGPLTAAEITAAQKAINFGYWTSPTAYAQAIERAVWAKLGIKPPQEPATIKESLIVGQEPAGLRETEPAPAAFGRIQGDA